LQLTVFSSRHKTHSAVLDSDINRQETFVRGELTNLHFPLFRRGIHVSSEAESDHGIIGKAC
jgi:hypothetical protein